MKQYEKFIKSLSLSERLRVRRLSLPSLELRRLYIDLIFRYKVVFDLMSIDFDDYSEIRSDLKTKGHAYKLFKPQFTASIRISNLKLKLKLKPW